MATSLQNTYYLYDAGDKSVCTSGVLAYTSFDSTTVYLCYYSLSETIPNMGYGSLASTMVHEVSHAVVHTQDLTYDRNQIK